MNLYLEHCFFVLESASRSRMEMFIRRKFDIQKLLVTAAGVIAVVAAAVVLLLDVKNLAGSSRPSEGSLIVNINIASETERELTAKQGGESRT